MGPSFAWMQKPSLQGRMYSVSHKILLNSYGCDSKSIAFTSHKLDDLGIRIAAGAGHLQSVKITLPVARLVAGEVLQVVPGVETTVMAITEGKFKRVITGDFQ